MRVRQALGVLFAAQLAALELGLRGPGALMARPALGGGLVASIGLLWLVQGRLSGRVPRALVALGLALVIITELAYFRYYHAPFDAQVALAARHAWVDVAPMLRRALPALAAGVLLIACLEYAWLGGAISPRLPPPLLGGLVLAGLVVARSPSAATAEIRVTHALLVLLGSREVRASNGRRALPELESERVELPDLLLLLTESVRASDACQTRGCPTGPELDRWLPERVTFSQARALSSYTALALSALTTGRLQLGPRADLAQALDVFDLARAVRAHGQRYSVRYWSSQLAGVFERGEIGAAADETVTAETLLGHAAADVEDSVGAGLDRRLGDLCERSLPAITGPKMVVVHLSGTHAPYFVDPSRAPYRPWQQHVTWSGLAELHRAYLNAILEQDRTVGRCLRAFLATVGRHPWVVIYTSDHGESFGEHAAIHHGQNLYDEQLHVPLLVAHGGGALDPTQAETLGRAAPSPVTHLDLLPTMLDLWGIRRHLAVVHASTQLAGRSLLGPLGPFRPLPITNCTELFPCPLSTWGVLGARRKLTAQAWDGGWQCSSIEREPEGPCALTECRDLVAAACGFFPRLPNGARDPTCPR